MKKSNPQKQFSRYSLAQLAIIAGQLSHLQSAKLGGKIFYLLSENIYKGWIDYLRKIIEKET